ncbi:unnamed protein product [Discula destructiva]
MGAYAAPESVPAVHASVALSRSDSGTKSSQGNRQRRQKNRKKGNNRDNLDGEARRRTEEEEKMAEEEAEREADVIRAMWAADRAVTASKTVHQEGPQTGRQGKEHKPDHTTKPMHKPNTPKANSRFQSRPARESPRRSEIVSPSRGTGTQGDPVASPQHDMAYRGHQLSNVTYADGNRDEAPHPEWQRSPNPRDRYGPPTVNAGRPRSRSPVYQEHSRPLPCGQYSQRSPPYQQPERPVYQPRPPFNVDDIRYEREHPARDDYVNYGPPGPAPELIEYEITEYRNPDGTITIEERPLRRIPNSEAERYYREAPPSAAAPFERGEPLPPPPPSYRRDQPRPPIAGEPYHASYDRVYSRAQPAPPPPQPFWETEAYDPRYPSAAPTHRNEHMAPPPPPRVEPAYYGNEEYDPRFPNGPLHAPVPPRPNYR